MRNNSSIVNKGNNDKEKEERSPKRATFLCPVDSSIFDDNTLTNFDIINKDMGNTEFPQRAELQNKITRCRLLGCQLTSAPETLTFYTNIQTLELTDNLLQTFPPNYFASFKRLKTLDLSVNNLKNLSGIIFPDSLTSLELSYNKGFNIESIWETRIANLEILKVCSCGIKDLPSKAPCWSSSLKQFILNNNDFSSIPKVLKKFEKIEQVHLFGNLITVFEPKSIPTQVKIFDLSYNDIESLDNLPDIDNTEENENVSNSNDKNDNNNENNNTDNNKGKDDNDDNENNENNDYSDNEEDDEICINSLNMNCCPFKKFPTKTFLIDNLKVLTLNRCGFEGKLDFAISPSLVSLEASNNKITILGKQFVQSLKNLSILNLEKNEIHKISNNFPSELMRLTVLVLDKNQIEILPPSLLCLKGLESFSVANNNIRSFPEFHFPKIRTFNISFNKISRIPDSFSGCSFLTDVNLAFNQLTELPTSMQTARKMMSINISSNKFRKFPKILLSYPQLRTLVMAGNLLNVIPNAVSSFMFLKSLDLSNNHFTSLPASIQNLRSLKTFTASHNLIKDVSKLPINLTLLDMSYNKLKEFNTQPMNSLQSLNLDFNQITTIDFTLFPNVQFFAISMNPLQIEIPEMLYEMSQKNPTLKSAEYIKYVENDDFIKTKTGTTGANDNNNKSTSTESEIPPTKFHFLSNNTINFPPKLGIGYSATMGDRASMEDAILVHSFDSAINSKSSHQNNNQNSNPISEFGIREACLLGVFDGHMGNVAASVASRCIVNEVSKIILGEVNNDNDSLPDQSALKDRHFSENNFKQICANKDISADKRSPLQNRRKSYDSKVHVHKGEGQRPGEANSNSNVQDDTSSDNTESHNSSFSESDKCHYICNHFSQSFVNVNDTLLRYHVKDGCTAAVALIVDNCCFCVSVGDSRIVRVKRQSANHDENNSNNNNNNIENNNNINNNDNSNDYSNGNNDENKSNSNNKRHFHLIDNTSDSVRVTTDYKPLDRSEFKRLRSLGLSVTPEGRIERKLAVARSMGDFWQCPDKSVFVKPDVSFFDLNLDNDDIGLIIACDGLWDVIDDATAGRILRESVTGQDAATKLKNFAYAMGSKDNISVLAVILQPLPEHVGFAAANVIEELSEDEDEDEDDYVVPATLAQMSLPPLARSRR